MVVTARSQPDIDETVATLARSFPGQVNGCAADVSTETGRASLVQYVINLWGGLDVLVPDPLDIDVSNLSYNTARR